jgi:ubiquinone/menaquinone biosynthesis C-methylase UbiE
VEVGCGRGGGLSYIFDKFSPRSAVGIDLSPVAIKFCRDHYDLPEINFITANAEDLPFEDNSVDILINVESSHRYANMDKFLSEVKRVLKLGGKLLITDFRNHNSMHHLKQSLADSGLHQKMEEIITHKVLKALEMDDSRRRNLVRNIMPGFLHATGYDFAAVKGSRTYNKFADGRLVYFNYVMEKRHHADL